MGITSFYYFCFLAVCLILYYVIPKKAQWPFLLCASIFYFLTTGSYLLILYPVASVSCAYVSGIGIEKADRDGLKRFCCYGGVGVNLLILIVLKYLNFGVYTFNGLVDVMKLKAELLPVFNMLVPLGLSFYTLSIIGYIFDIYYGGIKAERNYFRLLLFGLYFPTIVSGPIVRYVALGKTLFSKRDFDYKRVTFGLQRIIWGCFKVLVISGRLSAIVNPVYNNPEEYKGTYVVVATIAFALELYTNFSGSIDVITGVSECFGVELPENFNTPFFSRSMQEFWRRWHITLGGWLKDYIFYPVLRTEFFMNLPGKLKEKYGKKKAKRITTFSAMFILWFAVGLWHGGSWKYIIGSGILHWCYILAEELGEPLWSKMRNFVHATKDTKWLRVWQSVRTFLLVCSGFVFFNAQGMRVAAKMLLSVFTTWNLKILVDGSLMEFIEIKDLAVVIAGLIVLFVVSLLHQTGSVRERIARRSLPVRWILYFMLIFSVILLGSYGPGYSAAEFIYQGF